MNDLSTLGHAILVAGLDDWLPARVIRELASQIDPEVSEHCRNDAVAAAVSSLLSAGLIDVGDVTDGGFFPWPGTIEESAGRLRLLMADASASIPVYFWTSNTETGEATALDRATAPDRSTGAHRSAESDEPAQPGSRCSDRGHSGNAQQPPTDERHRA